MPAAIRGASVRGAVAWQGCAVAWQGWQGCARFSLIVAVLFHLPPFPWPPPPSAGQTIGTEDEALNLSNANLSGGDFEGAKFIGTGRSTGGGGGSKSPFAFTCVAAPKPGRPFAFTCVAAPKPKIAVSCGAGPSLPPLPAPPCTVAMLRLRPADADAASWPIKCAGPTIGTVGEDLILSEAKLSGGNFEGAKFIGMSSIKLDGANFSTISTVGEQLILSEANLSYGDFEPKFI